MRLQREPALAQYAGNAPLFLAWKGVSHSFGPHEALADVNLRVEQGRVLTLAGRSGCGKTTLLAMAAGLLAPTRGEVVNGFAKTACVFQEPRLLPWRNALQNIAFSLKALGVQKSLRLAAARELAGRMGLRSCDLSKYPHELSGGMRQRVSLARALAAGPDLLLLDEPFSALDVGLRRELQDIVIARVLDDGLTAVFVTHDLLEAARVSRDIVILAPSPGRTVFRKTLGPSFEKRDAAYLYDAVAGLLREPAVAKAFQPSESETSADSAGPLHKKAKGRSIMNMSEVRLVTDMAGRKVTVPAQLDKIFGYNPMVTALIFALAPEKIAGLGMPPMPPERMMADEAYLSLPVLGAMGGLFGGGKSTFDNEAVKRSGAGAIISLSLSKIDEIETQAAEALQAELGLPVLIYDGALDRSGETLRRVGALVGEASRGLALADYFDEKFETIQRVLADIPRAKRRTAYYAQSPTGLLTEPRGARHAEIIEFAGGINVAEIHEQRGCGRTPISADDLLRWNPDVVILFSEEGKSSGRLYERMRADPFWSCLAAVKNSAVYEPPAGMYHWFDRPPSINRIIGLIWLADLLYPGRFGWDMEEEVMRFYELFYRIRLSPGQARGMLGTRGR
jgi:ABC-type taurine transport system ATPase subunit/ABC-type Fe3+-hydroxamate transport system substrate-binding protein